MRPLLSVALITLLFLSGLPGSAHDTPGIDFDPTFGDGGLVLTNFFGDYDAASALAIQPDGKLVAAGTASNSALSTTDFALARYKPDGGLDPTFGAGGKLTADISGLGDQAQAVALQPDGRIVVAGFSFTAANVSDFSLARFNPDGSPDLSFGSGGKVITDFFAAEDQAFGVIVQPDGRIVVAGYASDSGQQFTDFALVGYTLDGHLDNTFGDGGKVITDISGSNDEAYALARQPDGKLVAAGLAINTADFTTDFALARYNSDGSLDTTFGVGGKATTDFGNGSIAFALALQTDGKIVAAGETVPGAGGEAPAHGASNDFALARYNFDGSLDNTFGDGGKVTTEISEEDDVAQALAVQMDGHIVAAGFSGDPEESAEFALARYEPDGSLDPAFRNGRVRQDDHPDEANAFFAVAQQADGRIVAAGQAGNHDRPDFALARFVDLAFDICLQDEQTGNLLRFNSTTGVYQVSSCAKRQSWTGIGTVTRAGCKIELRDRGPDPKRPDRNLSAMANACTRAGSASVEIFSPAAKFNITDRDMKNNTCVCR